MEMKILTGWKWLIENPEYLIIVGLFFLVIVLFSLTCYDFIREKRLPLYLRGMPQIVYTEEERNAFLQCYYKAHDIGMMLQVCEQQFKNKKQKIHLRAAIGYLKESRYRDFETALYFYASDSSEATRDIFSKIIDEEIRKYQRIPELVERRQPDDKRGFYSLTKGVTQK